MKNILAYILVIVLVCALLFVLYKIDLFAFNVEKEEEGILFYDATIVEVIGVEEIAPNTWMLPSGEHRVVTINGETLTVQASNGSWQYIQ